jgi:deoxyribonuclease V
VSTAASEVEDPGTEPAAEDNFSPDPDISEALREQMALRSKVDIANSLITIPELVAGLDVSYEAGTRRVAAVAVVMESRTLEVREISTVHGEVHFPYVPGLLAFREAPILLEVLENLACQPEVLVCDGYGIAHPARCGLASHMGVLTGLPSLGVAKSPFVGTFAEPGKQRGEWSPLTEDGETLGRVLRTQTGIRPVFVSVGHRIGLDQATDLTLKLSRRYRIPEVIRQADILSREALRKLRE